MKRFVTARMGIVATLLFGAGQAVGCGGRSASGAPAATAASAPAAAEDDEAAGLLEHHRHHHHGGVTLFIAMSLDTLGVSPDQRAAVEKVRADLLARLEPARAAEQSLLTTLGDGVAAGSIDSTKVDAAIAQLAAATGAVHDASDDALNQLHDVLTPPQRAALADKVEAHWAVWQKANADEGGQATPTGSHLAVLATELALTGDQVDRIRAGLAEGMRAVPRLDPQEVAAHVRTYGDAFRNEKFDARALAAASRADAQLAGWGSTRLAHLVEASMAVLTVEQRAQLAQRLREHATHNPAAQGNP